jgi:putative oxidoreductase
MTAPGDPHGLNKVFGGGGISGTARWFEGLGLRPWVFASRSLARRSSA